MYVQILESANITSDTFYVVDESLENQLQLHLILCNRVYPMSLCNSLNWCKVL